MGLEQNEQSAGHEWAVSSVASITAAASGEARLMMLCCLSGLWDVLSSQRAVDFARARLRAHNDAAACSRDLVRNGSLVHPYD